MHTRKCLAHGPALCGIRAFGRQAVKKGNDKGRAPFQRLKRLTITCCYWRRAWKATRGEVLLQGNEIGQVLGVCPSLKQGQDEPALICLEIVVRVLHPFRDTLEASWTANVIAVQESLKRIIGDLGVNRHGRLARAP